MADIIIHIKFYINSILIQTFKYYYIARKNISTRKFLFYNYLFTFSAIKV